MEFFGQQGNFIYTITIIDSKVESVLVEKPYTEYRRIYLRTKQLNALVINETIFKEAVKQYCTNNPEKWDKLYNALKSDSEYAKMMLEEYEKFIAPFLQTLIHHAFMKQQE